MGMRPVNDPFGGNATMVDKLIGNAYEIVKYVAQYLTQIRYVADNMAVVYEVGNNLRQTKLVEGSTGGAGVTVSVALPDGVVASKIVASSIMIQADTGDVYGADSGHFTANIQSNALRLTLSMTAPLSLQNKPFRWFITHTE